ncbi:MAG: RDD family protein [Dehalococcoidia bacterium]
MTVTSATAGGAARPAKRQLRIEFASFESRVAAAALDALVVFIIAALLVTAGSIVVLVSSDFEKSDPSNTSLSTFWGCVIAIAPAVLLYFLASYAWKGQTVGKAVMQLMVIRSDGHPLGILGALGRVVAQMAYPLIASAGILAAVIVRDSTPQAAGAVGGAFLLIFIGLASAAFDSRRRGLHDRIAGTIVVRIH